MQIVSLTNLKGGSAKSTTAFNLAGALVENGNKVLVVDLDPQQTLSYSYLGVDVTTPTLSDTLVDDLSMWKIVTDTAFDGLYAVPADGGLKAIKSGQTQLQGGELRLRSSLHRPVELNDPHGEITQFDWVLIDCPPSLDRLTMNALAAADFVLIPVDPGAGGRVALQDTVDYIGSAQKWYNPVLKILGMFINNVNRNTVYDQTTEEAVRSMYGDLVFDTVISSSVRIRESAEMQTPIVFCKGNEYKRYADGYRAFMNEVVTRVHRG